MLAWRWLGTRVYAGDRDRCAESACQVMRTMFAYTVLHRTFLFVQSSQPAHNFKCWKLGESVPPKRNGCSRLQSGFLNSTLRAARPDDARHPLRPSTTHTPSLPSCVCFFGITPLSIRNPQRPIQTAGARKRLTRHHVWTYVPPSCSPVAQYCVHSQSIERHKMAAALIRIGLALSKH